ncbi:MAG: NADPH-dependent assimilatory sulfite reductase hemoprotein subunit [Bacteroidetes bacterium]|nr:NADPH-dependent assimilatory sulfite reductase hemoprotein subunit [Bacteroidota bacterium]
MSEKKQLSAVEKTKTSSNGLRGTIKESLADNITGAVSEDDQNLIKFHGMYQQDDRDRREERAEKKLERLYSFMIRLRLPGGAISAEQWIAANEVANDYSTGTIKITTRQTIQLHGILKSNIKPTIQSFNKAKLDSIATCGDINRNVTCAAHPVQSPVHAEVFGYAKKISALLFPKTQAYYELWIDDEKIAEKDETDPLYQDRYLPRKFKIGIGIPPNNEVDVLTNDLALIAIIENNEFKGFNVAIGGGLSATHGNADTYPRLATVIGFVDTEEKILKTIYEIVTVQRDFGNRSDRKLARLKYTVDRIGIDSYKSEVEKRTGFALEPARPYTFTARKDYYGWQQSAQGKWYFTLFVENGRVLDDEQAAIKTALLEIAKTGACNFQFTASQNIIISNVEEKDKAAVHALLEKFKLIEHNEKASLIRKNAIACVALPTCPLALAEAQRYLPSLLDKIEPLLTKHQLDEQDIILRMTGCPNGCGRSTAAEIGFIGTAAGKYNLHLGGDNEGQRLNKLYKENADEPQILHELDQLFGLYQKSKQASESFGDFAIRTALV